MEEKLPTDLVRAGIYEDQAKIERSIKPPRLNFNEGSHELQRECKFQSAHLIYTTQQKAVNKIETSDDITKATHYPSSAKSTLQSFIRSVMEQPT